MLLLLLVLRPQSSSVALQGWSPWQHTAGLPQEHISGGLLELGSNAMHVRSEEHETMTIWLMITALKAVGAGCPNAWPMRACTLGMRQAHHSADSAAGGSLKGHHAYRFYHDCIGMRNNAWRNDVLH